MKNWILAPLLIMGLAFGGTGCTIFMSNDDGDAGVVLVEDMSEKDFNLLESDVALVVELGVVSAEPDAELAEELAVVSTALRLFATEGVTTTLVEQILGNNPDLDPAIVALIRLAENRIKEYGGFPYIEDEEGVKLTDRSKRLVLAIANGIDNGLGQL